MAPYQWKPGQSGNPQGRPPGLKALRAKLKSVDAYVTELEGFAFMDACGDEKLLRIKFEAVKLGLAYKVGPPGPLDEDMTVRDVLLGMTVERAQQLMEAGNGETK